MVSREGKVHIKDTLSGAFRRSEEALMSVGARIRKRDQVAGRLEAAFGFSWRSWGEKVGVDVLGVDGDALVQVKSSSALRTTLIDYGKNADNVLRFLTALQK